MNSSAAKLENGYPENMEATAVELKLTNEDRCDRCGAQALAKATFEWGELLFCKHHLTENRSGLEEGGARIEEVPVPA